jgi:uncharacterized protein YpmB
LKNFIIIIIITIIIIIIIIIFFFFFYGASACFRAMASPTFFLQSSYISEASVEVSKQIQVFQGGVVSPMSNLNPNLEDQGIPFCLGHHL